MIQINHAPIGMATIQNGSLVSVTKMSAVWILVADRGRARLFEADRADALRELQDFVNPDARVAEREQHYDRAARVNESMGAARHAIEPHTTLHDKLSARFAQQLQQVLDAGRRASRYERLVLIALPQFLGVIRAALPSQVHQAVVAEIPKELVTKTPSEIARYLPAQVFARPLA